MVSTGSEAPPKVKYCAFISYNRADTAVATWLLRRLETYRVPKRLVGTMGAHGVIGRRLGKVFRDRDELAAADDLGAVVRAGLADSDALIVICSPAAATSRWVNAEIEAFQKLGRPERIFAYVVAGSPGVAAGPDCPFPPALIARDAADTMQEPMAADARPSGDRACSVSATMRSRVGRRSAGSARSRRSPLLPSPAW